MEDHLGILSPFGFRTSHIPFTRSNFTDEDTDVTNRAMFLDYVVWLRFEEHWREIIQPYKSSIKVDLGEIAPEHSSQGALI